MIVDAREAAQLIDNLDPTAISDELAELDRRASALRVLLRAARARQAAQQRRDKEPKQRKPMADHKAS